MSGPNIPEDQLKDVDLDKRAVERSLSRESTDFEWVDHWRVQEDIKN